MVAAFLAVGAVWFWILMSVVIILLFLEVEYEKPGWATVTCALFFAALWLFGDFNVLQAIADNPLVAVGCIVGYLLLGTGWSFGKWWFYLKRCRREYDRIRADFMRQQKIEGDTIPADKRKAWREYWAHHVSYDYLSQRDDPRPRAGQHKGRIMTWMVYWPWSMVWTIINDPIKRAFKEIFLRLKAVYQAIADHVFKGVDEDFADPPDDGGGNPDHLQDAENALDNAPPGVDNFTGGTPLQDRLEPSPAGVAPENERRSGGGTPAK